MVSFLHILVMDVEDTRKSAMLEKIKREASTLGLHEAFLEAAPQLVLQLSIILRLGYFSKKNHVLYIVPNIF